MHFIELIDKKYNFPKYHIKDAWGFEVSKDEKTLYHSHATSLWSGVLYLNSSNQILQFPEINESVKPEEGAFALFSPFLEHGCEINKENTSKFGISFNMSETSDS